MASESKQVVVIGGSYAGTGVCHGLLRQLSNIKVTLINPSNEYYFNVASPRLLVKPDLIPRDKYLFSISDAFKKYPAESFHFVQGKASEIDTQNKLVKLEDDAPDVPYDYLVITSGSTTPATIGRDSFPAPFKAPVDGGLGSAIDRTQSAIQSAKSVIIGGAGPVGVEFAGEIVEAYGEGKKDVTLISGTDRVLPGLVDSGRDAAEQILHDKGIALKTGCLIERVAHDDETKQWSVVLSSGETLTADLYVSAMGPIPNNEFIPPSLLNEQGWVDVDRHLRAKNTHGEAEANIYAVGDITSHKERLLLRVAPQVSVAVANLKRDITGQGQLDSFLPEEQRNVMIVPIGRSTGTGMLAGWRVWGFMVSFMKGRHYFLGRAASYIQG